MDLASIVCNQFNATVPLPRNAKQNDDYRAAFNAMGATLGVTLDINDVDNENDWRDSAGNQITFFNWKAGWPANNLNADYVFTHSNPDS